VKVVQLIGAVEAGDQEYDGKVLVRRMAEILQGEAFYMNAPFLVDSIQTARALRAHQTIRETIDLAKQSDVAMFGIGTPTPPEFSSFYRSGHVTLEELEQLRSEGAVGDVCGYHFDQDGNACSLAFSERTIAIPGEDLLAIPIRLGVAGGVHKIPAIRGAIHAGYINVLVTDSQAAEGLLHPKGRE
jgi:DNA-binding transcriptional regulator LsrR (DeoR family)